MEQAKAKWDKTEKAREVGQLQRDLPDQLRRKEKAEAKAREEGKPISRKDKHILKLQAKRLHRSIHTAGRLWRYPNWTAPVVDWRPAKKPGAPPTAWEAAEMWSQARDEVGGVEPNDWQSPHVERCVALLSDASEQMRMSALHSLTCFISLHPLPQDEDLDELSPQRDALISTHGAAIVRALHRCILSESNSLEEKLMAVRVVAYFYLWSIEGQELVTERAPGLVRSLHTIATEGRFTLDDDDEAQTNPRGGRKQSKSQLSQDDFRAAVIELIGVFHFVELYEQVAGAEEEVEEDEGEETVEEAERVKQVITDIFIPLCSGHQAIPLRCAALSAIGLLTTLLAAEDLCPFIEENVDLLVECIECNEMSVPMAAIEALIVMFAIINDAYLAVDEEDEEKKVASVGQRDLFELENAISSLADRSGNDKELRALHDDVEQLLRVVRSLRVMSDLSAGDNEDENDDEDEREEGEEFVLHLRRACDSPKEEVMRVELIARNPWNTTRLRSLWAIAGPSLCIYARGTTLSELTKDIIDEEELVIRHRSQRSVDHEENEEWERRSFHQKKPKGVNKSKGLLDRSIQGKAIRSATQRSEAAGLKLKKDLPRRRRRFPNWYYRAQPPIEELPDLEPNTNHERPPQRHAPTQSFAGAAEWPRIVHLP